MGNRMPKYQPDKGVFIAWCQPGKTGGGFTESLAGLLLWDHVHGQHIVGHGGYISLASGPRIASGRTQLVDQFLAHPSKPDWLLMVDADMVFEPDLVTRMLEVADRKDIPVLGGLCFAGGRGARMYPTIYALNGDGARMDKYLTYPRDTLVKVDGTGTGCLLVHRRVYEEMAGKYPRPYPWFAEAVIDGEEYGEDITFCLRLNRMRIPVHVHTGIKLGHEKTMVYDEALYEEWLLKNHGLELDDDTNTQQAIEVAG